MLILITGTSAGIGRGLAEYFAGKGHTVLGCGRRSSPIACERYRHFQADLTSTDAVKQMFQTVRQDYGQLDALINNAGVSVMNPFLLTSESEIERIFDVNVFAMLRCSREAVKLMRHSAYEAPSIVNISTVAVPWSIPGQSIYACSKSAVEQATRSLSHELSEFNVRINTIGLPPVRTALTRTVKPEKIQALVERQALRRMCKIEDLTGPVEFFLSSAARFVTGATLYLGGVA